MSRFRDLLHHWRIEFPQALLLGLSYFAAALLAVRYTRLDGGVALLWIATPILAVDLRYRPERSWTLRMVVCAAASALATSLQGLGAAVALPMAAINVFEGSAIAWLMRRLEPEPGHLTSVRELGTLIVVAGILVPGLTALPAGALAHYAAGVPITHNMIGWFCAHALGTLTVMPIVKLAVGGDISGWVRKVDRRELIEAGALTALMVAVTSFVFASRYPLLYVPFVPLLLMVFRIGRLGAAISLLVLTVVGTACTAEGLGPITPPGTGIGTKLQLFQLYLVFATLIALPVATELKRRKLLFSAVQEGAALHRIIADRSGDIIMAVDADGTIRFASPSLSVIAGFSPAAVTGRLARDVVAFEDIDRVIRAHRNAMADPAATVMFEFRAHKASGELAWFESHARAISAEDGEVTGTVNVVREVSRRKARELNLARAAATDPLTGLSNRRIFTAAYEDAIADVTACHGRSYLALFDLDFFKRVNDRFGHATGDDVLRAFAAILKANVRSADTVARLGGEEFGVLFDGLSQVEAQEACERVRAQFAAATVTAPDGSSVATTVSVGLAALREDRSLAEALRAADAALYASKGAGRNRLSIAA